MAGSVDSSSALVLSRFGLGARPGDLSASGRDLLTAMSAETHVPAPLPKGDLPDAIDALSELDEFRTERRKKREAAAGRTAGLSPLLPLPGTRESQAMANAPTGPAPVLPPGPAMAPPPAARSPQPYPQKVYRDEAEARLALALGTPLGFAERWVWFWSNHFCVSVIKGQPLRVLAGNYERTVVRPHAFGRFGDMLKASVRHPAMLIYLDNRQSIGPNSRAGERRGRGLNENLAREILELHTLGVNGGYTQADVTNFAKMLTGWTVIGPNDEDGEIGEFRFNRNRHEPGPQVLLGRSYPDTGVEQAEAALASVASHPSTASFMATKLARHFVADSPPPALVARLAKVFRDTQGDLGEVARTLLAAPEALQPAALKLRSPQEFVVAALRATGRKPDLGPYFQALNALGQQLWNPPGPNGYADTLATWANPEGMKVRLELASSIARVTPGTQSPTEMLDAVLGPRASDLTRQAVARAESRMQGIALLLMSPEFQRR